MTPSAIQEITWQWLSCSYSSKPTKLTHKFTRVEEAELLAHTDSLASEQNVDSQSREP